MWRMKGNPTLEELLRDGWLVIKRGDGEYYHDAENAILRTHVTLHEFFRSSNKKHGRSSGNPGGDAKFLPSARLALANHQEKDRLLAELKILNNARNAIAHEWAYVPRVQKVEPLFRLLLRDPNLRVGLPPRDVSLKFREALNAWEAEVLAAIGVRFQYYP